MFSQGDTPTRAFAMLAYQKHTEQDVQALFNINTHQRAPAHDLRSAQYQVNCESGSSVAGPRGEANAPTTLSQQKTLQKQKTQQSTPGNLTALSSPSWTPSPSHSMSSSCSDVWS
jgi:hypothetical protein